MTAPKQLAHGWIEEHRRALSEWQRTIWEFAEPAWREYRSAAWFVERGVREPAKFVGMLAPGF